MQRHRYITLIIPLFLLGSGIASASFNDTDSSPYRSAIRGLLDRGIVQGYADGTFRPNVGINRAEFLSILMDSRFPGRYPADERCFRDLDVKIPQWYARTTCAAKELGIVRGYGDGTFRPERTVQLDEALKMALLVYGFLPEVSGGRWYDPYLREARLRGMLVSLLFDPAHKLTRGEMAEITYRLVVNEESIRNISYVTPVCGNGVTEGYEQCDDGNTEDSDGCSAICIVVPEPLRRAILNINQQTTGTITTVANGQKNLTLLKFTAVAGRQDALLASLTFEPSAGSLLYAKNYSLLMDRNGDGIFETIAQLGGKVEAGRLIFDSLEGGSILLPEGLIVPFLVRADLVSALGPVTLGLKFATSLPDYIEAQGAIDGLTLEGVETDNLCTANNCFIRVNTSGSASINVTERGSLFLMQDTMPVGSHILLNSTTTDTLLRLRLRAESEKIDLKSISFDGIVSSVDSLLLYRLSPGQSLNTGTMTPFAQASNGQCTNQPSTRVCAILPYLTFVVDPAQETVIAVAARMKSDAIGGVSGQDMTITVASATDATGRAVEARGISSTRELAQNDGNGVANGEIFVGTSSPQPNAQITGSTSDTGFASIGRILRDGPVTERYVPTGYHSIGAFTFAALPHTNARLGYDDVVLQSLTFSVTAQNVQVDPLSFTLSTKSNPEAQLPCTAGASTGTFSVVCSGIQSGSIQSHIGQGESLTYLLSANVTNGQIVSGTSILTVTLPVLAARSQTNSVQWSDQTTVFPWVDVPETSIGGTVYQN